MTNISRITEHGHTAVVEHNGVLYLGGIAAEDLSQPLDGQMRQVLKEVDRVLAAAGSSKRSILQARVNLIDFAGKDVMNAVWVDWLGDAALPARSTNALASIGDGVLVEVVIIAAKEE
ncbi:MAG TPA: RidA family protein [Propionibacteriaceae bacterium]|jgi:Putative translation initiation inhibitor, yjgF family